MITVTQVDYQDKIKIYEISLDDGDSITVHEGELESLYKQLQVIMNYKELAKEV